MSKDTASNSEDNKSEEKPKKAEMVNGQRVAYIITVDDKSCKLRKLDRHTLGVVMSLAGQDPPETLKAGETILRTCWLEGDKEILDVDEYFMAACMGTFKMVEIKTADVKKL